MTAREAFVIRSVSFATSVLSLIALLIIEFLWRPSLILAGPVLLNAVTLVCSVSGLSERPRQIEYKPVECYHVWGKWSRATVKIQDLYGHMNESACQIRACDECGFTQRKTL